MRKIILIIFIFFFHTQANSQNTTIPNDSYIDYINIYQKYISPIKGSHCPMYPSCSNYGLQAFKTYNPLKAFTLTSDRLMRCGHEYEFYDITLQDNGFRFIDFPDSSLFNKNMIHSNNKSFYAFSDTIYPKNQSLEFAKYLINKQYFQQALLQISELLFLNNCKHKIELYTNYLICLRALDMQEKGLFEYETAFPVEIKQNTNVLAEIGNLWIDLDNYKNANKYFEKAQQNSTQIEIKNKLQMQIAYTFLKQENWNFATASYNNISKNSLYYQNAQNNLLKVNDITNIKYKKPAIAGLLSVIPGLGYLYSSHKQTAISALVINSLLLYGTYTSIKKENYGMASLVGLFSFSFYIGNFSGAIKSAKRYNKKQLDNKINQIIK